MKEAEFQAVDEVADVAFDAAEIWLASPQLVELKRAMKKALANLPQEFSIELGVELRVFDEQREKSIRLLTTGLNAHGGEEPYRVGGDSTVQRYVTDGEICQLPHDYCPHCWGLWDFKLLHPQCPECGYSLGKEVRLLLDSDVCPHCERGTVTAAKPNCEECGLQIDPSWVTWG